MPIFRPPTVDESPAGGGRLFFRYRIARGISVVKKAGHYVKDRFPTTDDLAGLTEGTDYFLGGHEYVVSIDIANALTADGFIVATDDVYLANYTETY